MASESELLSRVRNAFKGVRNVDEKRMFGGTAFMVRGNMCVTVRDERMMCRVGPEQQPAALKRKGASKVIMNGREYRGFVYVDGAVIGTESALSSWIEKALAFNKTLPKK
ncbi:MAG: TfoX/Sxy family protein [Bacteroidetes bacterium]|nr:TfoX/Sxy family protein [Bacteroidota bacterium]